MYGGRGKDQVFGSQGFDRVFGGRGNDFINVLDERGDVVDCGGGTFDEVYVDPEDEILRSPEGGVCEAIFEAEFEPPQNAEALGPQELSRLPAGTFVEE